jgi:hypothetical protein
MCFRKRVVLVAAFAALTHTSLAHAQGIAVFGSAEAAGDDVTLLLLGGAWSPGRVGWQPYASVIAYNLRFNPGPGLSASRNVLAPQLGLRYQTPVAATQIGGGYSFTDDTTTGAFNVAAESGEGPFVAFQWNHWGTGIRALEAIASYGIDTKFLWSRFTGLQRLAQASPLYVGGEATLFGSGGDNDFWTTQVGPAIEWRFTPAFRLGLAAGLKIGLAPAANDQSDAYGRLSFLWLPGAR